MKTALIMIMMTFTLTSCVYENEPFLIKNFDSTEADSYKKVVSDSVRECWLTNAIQSKK